MNNIGYHKLLFMFLAAFMLPETLFTEHGNRRLVAATNKIAEACYPSKDFS